MSGSSNSTEIWEKSEFQSLEWFQTHQIELVKFLIDLSQFDVLDTSIIEEALFDFTEVENDKYKVEFDDLDIF